MKHTIPILLSRHPTVDAPASVKRINPVSFPFQSRKKFGENVRHRWGGQGGKRGREQSCGSPAGDGDRLGEVMVLVMLAVSQDPKNVAELTNYIQNMLQQMQDR